MWLYIVEFTEHTGQLNVSLISRTGRANDNYTILWKGRLVLFNDQELTIYLDHCIQDYLLTLGGYTVGKAEAGDFGPK